MVSRTPRHAPAPARSGRQALVVSLGDGLEVQRATGLTSVTVDHRIGMVGIAELTLGGGDATWTGLEPGRRVQIRVAGSSGSPALFEGSITALRHQHRRGQASLTVVASDALHRLAVHTRSRAFGDPDRGVKHTDSQIVEQVVSHLGLTARVDRSEALRPYVVQSNESDLTFVLRLAARNDWTLCAEGPSTVVCGRRRAGAEVTVPRDGGGLIDLDYTWSPHAVPEQVAVSGWDYLSKRRTPAHASQVEAVGGGFRTTRTTGDPSMGAHLGEAHVQQPAAAAELARGALDRMAHALLRGRARIEGNGLVRPHTVVRFTGHPRGFNPIAHVVATRHRLVDGQYITDLRFTSNVPPGATP